MTNAGDPKEAAKQLEVENVGRKDMMKSIWGSSLGNGTHICIKAFFNS